MKKSKVDLAKKLVALQEKSNSLDEELRELEKL